jgi:hypothetical protein
MNREEWMYKIPRVSNDLSSLVHVKKFVVAAKKHRLCLGQDHNICLCNSCKNKLLQEDPTWCEEADSSATSASGGNSSMVNDGGQQPSASTTATGGDSANRDYISIHDRFEDMADNDGGSGDGEQIDVLGPEDAEVFQNIANRMDQDDILFRNPKWLENFKEMKQVAIDPLYKGCPKH